MCPIQYDLCSVTCCFQRDAADLRAAHAQVVQLAVGQGAQLIESRAVYAALLAASLECGHQRGKAVFQGRCGCSVQVDCNQGSLVSSVFVIIRLVLVM